MSPVVSPSELLLVSPAVSPSELPMASPVVSPSESPVVSPAVSPSESPAVSPLFSPFDDSLDTAAATTVTSPCFSLIKLSEMESRLVTGSKEIPSGLSVPFV